mgnify:CR=1 FL=1
MSRLNSRPTFAVIFLLAAALAFTGGCSRPTSTTGEVRIAFFPNITHAPALVGIADGRFQQALGSDRTLMTRAFKAGPELMVALAAGEIDLAYVGPVPAMAAASRGVPVVILSGVTSGGVGLIVAPESGIRNLSSLKGGIVGVPQFGNTQDVQMRLLLKNAGVQEGRREGVTLAQAEAPDAGVLLRARSIQAALLPEPWASLYEQSGQAVRVHSGDLESLEGMPSVVLVARRDFVLGNPEMIAALLEAQKQVFADIRQHPEKSIRVSRKMILDITRKALPVEVVRGAFANCRFGPELTEQRMKEISRISEELGYIKAPFRYRDISWKEQLLAGN